MNFKIFTTWGLSGLLAVALTAGTVHAATPTTGQGASSIDKTHIHKNKGDSYFAQVLGVDASTLKLDLKAGKTLAQIAAAKGMDANTLTQKLKAAMNDRIDKAVASGKLTAEKATQIKTRESSEIAQKINQPLKGKAGKNRNEHKNFNKSMGQTLQTLLGLNAAQLKEEIKKGKTIAQIAKDKGINQADLTTKLEAAMTSSIDQAVKDKKLTSDQATQHKAKIPQRIQNMINHLPQAK